MPSEQLTKKERRQLQRQQKFTVEQRRARAQKVKNAILLAAVLFGLGGAAWALVRWGGGGEPLRDEDVLSRNGLHWHASLSIPILGKEQEIPANIGIGAIHSPIHTHEEDGIIHLEIQGLVTKDDTKLGRFFENWDRTFNADCIFEFCNGPEGTLRMLVNGQENTEFAQYPMKDGDKIEVRYE
ncbi:MAG: hypothetical protein HY475_01050 [Candidatus Terrybacteria bacterium]|nr:hypothetical protein [Candidatus Terrybacteria bacterium]